MSIDMIAHWPLDGDTRDALGRHHGEARGVTFAGGPEGQPGPAAHFDGPDSLIEVADAPELRLGTGDFTLSAWIRCDMPMRSVFGDILSKFDPATRCGVNLTVAGSSPAYNAMSDTRHIHFGVDDGYVGSWDDCGKPWPSNALVTCLIVYEGELYCGIAEADDPSDACRVFRWDGGQDWLDCGRLGSDPEHLSVQSMIVHGGRLYAGTGIYDWVRAQGAREGCPVASPTRVYVWEGGTEWRDLGQIGEGSRVLCLGSFGDELYAGIDKLGGGTCYKFDGSEWTDCGAPDGRNFECFQPHGGVLYASTHGNVWRYEGGENWACIGEDPFGINQIHTMQVFGGKPLIGTWPQGYAMRYEDDGELTIIGRLGIPTGLRECNEINDLTVHNGKLYAGVIPKSQVYRYEADGQWTLLANLVRRDDWEMDDYPTWSRVTSITSHQGKLFCSTGSCEGRAADAPADESLGRVFSLQTGLMASHERDIGGEWTHLAAVRQGQQLSLYVNGSLAATSELSGAGTFDLTNTEPLHIGSGAQTSLAGSIADVRLYGAALDDEQTRRLAATGLTA